ncbi:MAG: RDD family protein [Legionellales bacterium]
MIEKKYRTFWRRLWAGAIDSTVFWPLSFVYKWVWTTFQDRPVLLLFWFIFSSTAFHIYSIIFHGIYGQTLGKMAVNVKAFDISGNKLTMLQAFRRDMIPLFLFSISLAIDGPKILHGIYPQNPAFLKINFFFFLTLLTGMGWYLAELVTMFTNNKRRAIHDYIAGSVVIKTEKAINRRWSWTAGIAVVIYFILYFALPMCKGVHKEYEHRLHSIDHSKTSQNIAASLKPDKNYPYIGFWKKDCKTDVGLAIDKTNDGKYSVSLCTRTGCYKPGTYRPNTSLIDDQKYRIINDNIIELAVVGDYYWRYYKCSP